MTDKLDLEAVKSACPRTLKSSVTQDFVDKVNNIHTDPLIRAAMQETTLGFINILSEGRFKADDYLSAVKYVTYKMSCSTNQEAYAKAFPDRFKKFLADGLDAKAISAYVAMYSKGKLVSMLLERALIPVWLVNADNYQKAINAQVTLMNNAQSEMVRTQAANSILTHIKQPEVAKVDIKITDDTQTSVLDELRRATQLLSAQQRTSIELGDLSAKDIAHSDVLSAEYTKVNT
jgi:hypothetical protein